MKLVQINEDLANLSDKLKDKVAVALNDTEAQVALETDEKKKEVKKDTKPAVDSTNELAKKTNADGKAKEIFESLKDDDIIVSREEIADDINDAINRVFVKYQDKLGITDGGIEPLIAHELDDAIENLIDNVGKTLQWQYDFKDQKEESLKKNFKEELAVKDGNGFKCPNCGKPAYGFLHSFMCKENYCPNCGIKIEVPTNVNEATYQIKDLDDKEIKDGSKYNSEDIRNIVIGSLISKDHNNTISAIRSLLNKLDDETVIKIMKTINNYDVKKLTESKLNEDEIGHSGEMVGEPIEPEDYGIDTAVTDLIKRGWENIDQVNSIKATFESLPNELKIALELILDDNMTHIGLLEGCLGKPNEIADEEEIGESFSLKEGTWALPFSTKAIDELETIMSKPLQGNVAFKKLNTVFGDDSLFDDIDENSKDVRDTVRKHIGRLINEYEKDNLLFKDKLSKNNLERKKKLI